MKPDVVACQEVFQAAGADTGRDLADHLGMYYHGSSTRCKPRLFEGLIMESCSGLGLLSQYPIVNTDTIKLPMNERDGERTALFCQLDCDGTTVLVINTHLTHLYNGSTLRKAQLQAILAQVDLYEKDIPIFLCGDFNADLHSDEIQYLLAHPTVSVHNLYQVGNGKQPCYTVVNQSGEPSAEGKSIDFIFSLSYNHSSHPHVTDARIVLDTPDEAGIYPSDHFGVMIQAELS
ncbi:hypothetical protein BN8_00504 [Fibrisoma limi BUZ 3]|uniref:Endonuclease/exonuclease/phosphatase domain-containing protein n=1 Tax=Fibrisoma limi BUZ 3 TaxID=1185876 RepID=I2GCF1_9BACT|nr:hypothetical protein BN8_00504 [Fibrisoma limi BUZ 3]